MQARYSAPQKQRCEVGTNWTGHFLGLTDQRGMKSACGVGWMRYARPSKGSRVQRVGEGHLNMAHRMARIAFGHAALSLTQHVQCVGH